MLSQTKPLVRLAGPIKYWEHIVRLLSRDIAPVAFFFLILRTSLAFFLLRPEKFPPFDIEEIFIGMNEKG